MRKIVIFTMILTLIFSTVGCTVHSEPDKKAAESSSTNAIIDTTKAEELTEKTEDETVEKSTFAEETTQPTTTKTDTEKVSKEPIFSQSTAANTEPKQDTHTQKEMHKSEISELEIITNTVSKVTTAVEWLGENNRSSGYLFLNRYGDRITTRGISQQLKNYADKYGLDKKVVYPHSFRHRYAKNFLEKYNDIALLADLMGHESIETTRIYLRRTASEQQALVDKIVTW